MWVLYRGHLGVEVMKALLDRGADVNVKTVNGYTALKFAEVGGPKEIVELLKANGGKE